MAEKKKDTAAAKPADQQPLERKGFTRGFGDFIRQYSVIPLAIAVVLGNAVNDIVRQIVEGMVTPFVSLLLPGTALQTYEFTVASSTFKVGAVINAILSFIVIAFIVYFFAKRVLRDEALLQKK
jgi:large conductance mechanosensitive channel